MIVLMPTRRDCCVLLQYCERCCGHQDMQKRFSIAEPPNVLILHLKRFDVLTDTKVSPRTNAAILALS